jgi:hypothetical protein
MESFRENRPSRLHVCIKDNNDQIRAIVLDTGDFPKKDVKTAPSNGKNMRSKISISSSSPD